MKSPKTTILGILASLCGAIAYYAPQYAPIAAPAALIFTGMIGVASKDANVTGGTIAATTEAQDRIPLASPSKLEQILTILFRSQLPVKELTPAKDMIQVTAKSESK